MCVCRSVSVCELPPDHHKLPPDHQNNTRQKLVASRPSELPPDHHKLPPDHQNNTGQKLVASGPSELPPDYQFYAELEDAEEALKNVWLTDVIKKELDTYSVEEGNTFIMALGTAESKEIGNVFWVLVDVVGQSENVYGDNKNMTSRQAEYYKKLS